MVSLSLSDFPQQLPNENEGRAADIWSSNYRLSGRFVFGPVDMEELVAKKDEIVEKDLLKLKLTI